VAEIRQAIAELPEKQRKRWCCATSAACYDEVGAALGLSRPSVEAALRAAGASGSPKPLAGGALVVPIAVRGSCQARCPVSRLPLREPALSPGGVTASAVGGGLFAKLAAAPVAAKMATAAVAVGAAGSVGVVEAEARYRAATR
jgi:hypothetical protein